MSNGESSGSDKRERVFPHDDHPLRHFDRTCAACRIEELEGANAVLGEKCAEFERCMKVLMESSAENLRASHSAELNNVSVAQSSAGPRASASVEHPGSNREALVKTQPGTPPRPTELTPSARSCSRCDMEIEAGATITKCQIEDCPELEMCSGCRRLANRVAKIDRVLDELGAPKNGDWDGLNCALSQVGRIKAVVKRAEDEVELYRGQLHDANVALAEARTSSSHASTRDAALEEAAAYLESDDPEFNPLNKSAREFYALRLRKLKNTPIAASATRRSE